MALSARAVRGVTSGPGGAEALEKDRSEPDCSKASTGLGSTEAVSPHRTVAGYALQPVALTRPMLLPDLYRRVAGSSDAEEREDALFLPPSCSVDFNAFVNVFFEWHWLRWTGLTAEALELDVKGAGDLRVTRTLRDGQAERVAAQPIATGRVRVAIPPPSQAPGTLSFAVEARGEGGLTISDAVWSTRAAPRRAVSLDVVICTFNKRDMLRTSLDALCRLGLTTGLGRVIVVDQGSDRLAADGVLGAPARQAMASGRLVVIEQSNLGGTGGFTRGILEALGVEGPSACTHMLLMDDDVLFEPRLLSRLVAFLGRLPDDAVVGGSMLDMMRPHHLFAYSERFNHRTGHCERLHPRDLDLRATRHVAALEDAPTGNYNGWFICCFPRSAFEVHGLPLPMFVRSDDCEFGLRLSSRGVPLIHMPALFVWHEPFWLKHRAWVEVYTLRNHLIVANIASPDYDWRLALRRLGEFWYYVSTYQYEVAYACCMAVEGFLEGPASVFGGMLGWHRSIMAEISGFEEALRLGFPVGRSGSCPQRGARPKPCFHSLLPRFVRWPLNILWNLRGRTSRPVLGAEAHQAVPQDRLSWDSFHRFPVVLVDLADGQTSLARFHDAAIARRLTARMLKLVAKLLWSGRRLRRRYRDAACSYHSQSFWEEMFASSRQRSPR